eukprot:1680267-Karenia_brevis.AAC.1
MRSWKQSRPSGHRIPLPFILLQAMFIMCLELGFKGGANKGHFFCMAVLIRIGFFGMMRPGELVGLRGSDVTIVDQGVSCPTAVLIIRRPKTKDTFGRTQFSTVTDICSIKWLRWLVWDLAPYTKLWAGSTGSFRRIRHMVLKELDLHRLGITPA